jgi:hypothetical protein
LRLIDVQPGLLSQAQQSLDPASLALHAAKPANWRHTWISSTPLLACYSKFAHPGSIHTTK